jgi:hypothetical protein
MTAVKNTENTKIPGRFVETILTGRHENRKGTGILKPFLRLLHVFMFSCQKFRQSGKFGNSIKILPFLS